MDTLTVNLGATSCVARHYSVHRDVPAVSSR